ncbi:M48 family metallopeptidase [Cephaloticoccus capnophilus]|nr:SprT family zinc-dependent metalloprotease [Cephaloticoccus capnophilus]
MLGQNTVNLSPEEAVQGDLFELWRQGDAEVKAVVAPDGRAASGGQIKGAAGAIRFERSVRARHYRLTLRRDGTALVTIPAHGSQRAAEKFAAQHAEWLARARERQAQRPQVPTVWALGTAVLWRGKPCEIRVASAAELGSSKWRVQLSLGGELFRVATLAGDLRPTLEAHFARIARAELPLRTAELAASVGLAVRRVTVRDQRSRWGSCSSRGTISLNWRLVQTPAFVRDYIIYHELMHLKEMNHSARFWARVEEVCSVWREAEAWLKQNASLLAAA